MLTVTVGKTRMTRRQNRVLQVVMVMVPVVVLVTFLLQNYSNAFTFDWRRALSEGAAPRTSKAPPKPSVSGSCVLTKECPEDHFSFFIQSGAANVVAPKICVQNKLVLGSVLNNAGYGINIVIINGKTGEVTKIASFEMYSGDVKPLIELLKSITDGSVVLMASYDEPATKLNADARKLISELGSSAVQSLAFRDNWVFVGGKGAAVKSSFEKLMKNDNAKNKYKNWPEIIDLQGCIPKYLN